MSSDIAPSAKILDFRGVNFYIYPAQNSTSYIDIWVDRNTTTEIPTTIGVVAYSSYKYEGTWRYLRNCQSDAFYHMRGSIELRSEVKYFVDFDIFPIVIAENVTRV